MSGLSRFVSVLRLFSPDKPDWTVPQIGDALDVPHSTAYRTVRELADQGFIEPSTEANYRLGSAFVEFDRMIRMTDPLVRSGAPLLRDLVHEARVPCVALLSRLYGERVICAADERSADSGVNTSYERGRPMPLLRGATSKAILAQLPARRLKKLLEARGPDDSDEATPAFLASLSNVKRLGYCVTRGEVDKELAGVSVPVTFPALAISASLSVVVRGENLTEQVEQRLILLLISSSNLVVERLRALNETGAGR